MDALAQAYESVFVKHVPEATNDDEIEVIKAAAGGCHESFTKLVLRHQNQIYQLCLRLLQCHDDAREATQEVFLSAFRALPNYRPKAKFSTWLYQIALNHCRDHWKRSSRKISSKSQSLDESNSSLHTGLTKPDLTTEWSDELNRLDRSLKALTAKHREVIILCCVEGLDHAECASILKCSTRAVEGRLRRARKCLRKLWEERA